MLSLWNPFLPERVQSDSRISPKSYFDRLIDDSFGTMVQDLFHAPIPQLGIESKKNEDGSLAVSIDVPGIKENDIVIEVDGNILTVKGERKTATSSYKMQKSFTIPEGYDTNKITAELKDGVLSLNIVGQPPTPPREVKKIPVITGK